MCVCMHAPVHKTKDCMRQHCPLKCIHCDAQTLSEAYVGFRGLCTHQLFLLPLYDTYTFHYSWGISCHALTQSKNIFHTTFFIAREERLWVNKAISPPTHTPTPTKGIEMETCECISFSLFTFLNVPSLGSKGNSIHSRNSQPFTKEVNINASKVSLLNGWVIGFMHKELAPWVGVGNLFSCAMSGVSKSELVL